ncbi:hypothetical protein [Anaerococcus tetradius]|uniref:hypothetical protein n=1 Tax=Anaerococcus tetradius TaxID=33036 RepID=UPI0023F3DA7F|nr:hypothetical protein [Anaerococcus tetradius]
MTKYYNTKTRAIIDSPFLISGANWINYEDKDNEAEESVVETKKEDSELEVTNQSSSNEKFTKADIENELVALGIEYDKKSTKDELYALLMEQ